MGNSAHHRIDYIELSVTDMARAQGFFAAAFDWSFTDYSPGYAGFCAQGEDAEMGGLALCQEVKGGGPLVVIYSEDLEKSCTAVVEAGGTLTKKVFTFPGGRRFEFRCTEGNLLAVWTKKTD